MDAVIALSPLDGDGGEPDDSFAFQLEFRKARLRTPQNAAQFAPVIVRPGADWEISPSSKTRARGGLDRLEYLNAYERLADGIVVSAGFDGKPVRKVKSDAIRDELKSRGFLLLDDKGTTSSRKQLHDAKIARDTEAMARVAERAAGRRHFERRINIYRQDLGRHRDNQG
jgi:hypothetical protein